MANLEGAKSYLRTKVLTASSEELRLMLYDGAIKFSRQAASTLESGDFEASYQAIVRAKKIVLELSSNLNHNLMPELCERLAGLYIFIYQQLTDANVNRDATALNSAIQLLEYERETWQILLKQMAESQSDTDLSRTQQTALGSLSTSA